MGREHSPGMRGRRALVLVAGLSLLTACGLQRTGVQGTVSATTLTTDQGQPITTPGDTSSPEPGAVVPTGAAQTTTDAAGNVITVAPGGGPLPAASTTPGATRSGGAKASPTKASGLKGGSTKSTSTGQSPAAGSKLNGTLTVSVTHVGGFAELAKGIPGINIPDEGKQADADALAKYVNDHGGIAGKALVVKLHEYNAQQASPSNETAFCTELKGDNPFAVTIGGQIQPSSRGCYAAAKILTFEESTYGMPASIFSTYDPYYYAMSYPDYEEAEKAKVASLCSRKWFGAGSAVGATTQVGVAYWDDPLYKKVFDDVTTPALKSCGFAASGIHGVAVADGDIQSIESGLQSAAAQFQAAGATHVMFIGSAPLQPFFIQQEQGQGFIYGLSSFDGPIYEQYNEASEMKGSMGIGFNVDEDVDDKQVSFPQPGIEATCADIYKSEGDALPNRYSSSYNAKEALQWCQTVIWLKKVADEVGPSVTTTSWAARAGSDGLPFQGLFTWGSKFGPGDHHFASAYRDWAWDTGCSCTKYTGAVTSLS